MTAKFKAIDLLSGIGGMSVGLMDIGFDVVGVIDNKEDIEIYKSLSGDNPYIYEDIQKMNPIDLPEADVVTGRIILQDFSVAGKKREHADINNYIFNILSKKLPKIFLLEASTALITKSHGMELQAILLNLSDIGYKIVYEVLEERSYSGLPTAGKRLYIVGVRYDIMSEEFCFPDKIYTDYKINYDEMNSTNLNSGYKNIPEMENTKFVEGKFYSKNMGKFKETNLIYYGFTETYFADKKGIRRITCNELLKMRGFNLPENYQYSNKNILYRKIGNSSNVYVIRAIAQNLMEYLNNIDKIIIKDDYVELTKMNIKEKKRRSLKETNKIGLLPKHRITNIHIDELKGIKNLDICISKNLVAIMGVNGSGKSTILHALACMYSPYQRGEDHRFSFFFTPNPDSSWKNSKLIMTYFDENLQKEVSREYKKDFDRWSPRYEYRPKRDTYFLGITTCIPEIEIEKQTSYIDYSTDEANDDISQKIIRDAAYILNKDYKLLTSHKTKKKELLGVRTRDDLIYSSLSMGAGEQRIIKIIRLSYTVNQYSLILIDEIDLLLHVTALKRLIEILAIIAKKRNLQLIFTTHSLEMIHLAEYVDIRYLEKLNSKTLVYNSINPDFIYELCDSNTKPLEIYVEDLLAETVIKRISEDLGILSKVRIIKYGAASNAFVLAASYILKGECPNNTLIILDGDVFRTDEEKKDAIKKIFSGTEKDHSEKIEQALSMISDLKLPSDCTPEKFIYNLLVSVPENKEIINMAKKLNAVSDSHQWLDNLVERMGHDEGYILNCIIEIVTADTRWGDYIASIYQWMYDKKQELSIY